MNVWRTRVIVSLRVAMTPDCHKGNIVEISILPVNVWICVTCSNKWISFTVLSCEKAFDVSNISVLFWTSMEVFHTRLKQKSVVTVTCHYRKSIRYDQASCKLCHWVSACFYTIGWFVGSYERITIWPRPVKREIIYLISKPNIDLCAWLFDLIIVLNS